MEQKTPADLADMLKGTVDAIKAHLPECDDDDLRALHALEASQTAPRSTLLAAISSELVGRANGADAGDKPGVVEPDAEAGPQADEAGGSLPPWQDVPDPVDLALGKRPVKLAGKAWTVVFGDECEHEIQTLDPLDFPAEAFAEKRGALVLDQAITFERHAPPNDVRTVWLIDGEGRARGLCRLIQPLHVGGGRAAIIPAGYLAFRAKDD